MLHSEMVSCTCSLRILMKATLESINHYEQHMQECDLEDLNEVWQYMIENEKLHYGILAKLIRELDKDQSDAYEKICAHGFTLSFKIQASPLMVKKRRFILLSYIREDIMRELSQMNCNEIISMQIPLPAAVQVVKTINRNKKEHIEQLTRILTDLDTDSYGDLSALYFEGEGGYYD